MRNSVSGYAKAGACKFIDTFLLYVTMQLADCVSLTELNTPTYHKREIGMMSAGLRVKNMSLLISTSVLLKRGHKCHYRYFCIAHMKDVFNGMFVFPV